jgi:cytochrome c-type biogenesis protein CcmH/NrfG
MALKMRQSLAELEEEFREEMLLEESRADRLRRQAISRSRQRSRLRRQKRGTMRFWLLVTSLVLTAVVVTVAMFATLNALLG